MTLPDEQQWVRAEKLAEEFRLLSSADAATYLGRLLSAGESRTVLSILGSWLDLPPLPVPVQAGSIVGGRYTLKEKIGEGGMGSVWRAEQKIVGRDVALKMIHAPIASPNLNARFVHEIETLGRLNHPGIVRLFDAGIHEEPHSPAIPFFTMELVEGLPLDRWAAARRANPDVLLRLMVAVCAAIESAHERRVVHRDLKPANIMVKLDGTPVVLDFGIARLAGSVFGDETGVFSGTPQYAAPEQHLGHDSDFRTGESVDVYSTGAILFELLAGRKIFEFPKGTSLAEMHKTVIESSVKRLSVAWPGCPPVLDEIVGRALRRDPADRFYSIAALGRAINRAALLFHRAETIPPPWVPATGLTVPGTGWKLTEKMGEGSIGQIWLGIHSQSAERRLFKFCDTEEKARTLKRELTLYRLLKGRIGQNPHFVQLHEVSLDEAPWYLMMEYSEAKDLRLWCAAQPGGFEQVRLETRLEIVAQVAEALQAAHEAGILHRDIKPSNILIRNAGDNGAVTVQVSDFGIGQIIANKFVQEGTKLGFTQTVADLKHSSTAGTLLYMAPEVLSGNGATVRSDIYSLGVVLWQLLVCDFATALDPADWSSRIHDPLIRADLARCLAGAPDKRWASAGELAASLRALPERRSAAARQAAEVAARERVAYQRGVFRTAAVAAAIVAMVAFFGWFAWRQKKAAESARGQMALEQAASMPRVDFSIGGHERGLRLLETAVATITNQGEFRTVAAAVFGMPRLVHDKVSEPSREVTTHLQSPARPREVCRTTSPDGETLAIACNVDDLNGRIELVGTRSGEMRARVERQQFPWVPIAEPNLLRFSPDNSVIAIGGAATSRHIMLADAASGVVRSYFFHGSDPLSLAWHPGARIFATGCADGTVRVWDIAGSVNASRNSAKSNQFDIPPLLDIPANDIPVHVLRGHRGPVKQLAFASDGGWLASLDSVGYLRIHTGFTGNETLSSTSGITGVQLTSRSTPAFAIEARLDRPEEISALEAADGGLIVRRGTNIDETFRFLPGELPVHLQVASGITSLAWSPDSRELCAINLTDMFRLKAAPLRLIDRIPGENPLGIVSVPGDSWIFSKNAELVTRRFVDHDGGPRFTDTANVPILEAVKGQGARIGLAAADDGRVAVYRGRRIQFFQNGVAAPLESSVIASGSTGEFKQVLWDRKGTVLGVVFTLPGNRLRLESWETTVAFPPKTKPFPVAELDGEQLVSANNGRDFIVRSVLRGTYRFSPDTGKQVVLDTSSLARQNSVIAVSRNGDFLALVVDQNTVRLIKLPEGHFFAELHSDQPGELSALCWDWSGRHLAAVTDDGYLQLWNLGSWYEWLARYKLEK